LTTINFENNYLILGISNVDQTIALLVFSQNFAEVPFMNPHAVPQAGLKARFMLVPLAAAAMLLAAFAGSATAASPIAKDGTIHACYKVKGKPKGTLRVVPGKARCKRGERKVVWSAAGQGGQPGAAGQAGSAGGAGSGQAGQAGADGSQSPNEVALKTEVTSLNVKVDDLEKTLEGITHGDLVGTLSTLNGLDNTDLLGAVDSVKGLTNTDLTETVGALPVIDSLCEQNEKLTEQINLVAGVVGGLGLSPALELIGLLKIPTLPTALAPFSCATP
jgi:hypothetical protein